MSVLITKAEIEAQSIKNVIIGEVASEHGCPEVIHPRGMLPQEILDVLRRILVHSEAYSQSFLRKGSSKSSLLAELSGVAKPPGPGRA